MKHLCLSVALLVCSACISTSVTPLTSDSYEATKAWDVELYANEAEVPGPFVRLGEIHVKANLAFNDQRALLRKVLDECALVGANGLLLEHIKPTKDGPTVVGKIFGLPDDHTAQMVAVHVRYVDPILKPRAESGELLDQEPSFEAWLEQRDQPQD